MIKVKKEASFASKHKSFPYQVETVEEIKALDYAAIFHEQGLGKTKIAIDLALTWISEKALDSVVIITKKGLVRNWEEEITAHSYFKAKTLDHNPKTLFYGFNTPARLYLTHYEACKSAQNAFSLFLKTRRVGAICDESQKIKNPDSAIAKALHALSKGFARRVIMTGTPIANRPYDIWSQIWFLDQGDALGNDFKSFRSTLDLPHECTGLVGKEPLRRGSRRDLQENTALHCQRNKDLVWHRPAHKTGRKHPRRFRARARTHLHAVQKRVKGGSSPGFQTHHRRRRGHPQAPAAPRPGFLQPGSR